MGKLSLENGATRGYIKWGTIRRIGLFSEAVAIYNKLHAQGGAEVTGGNLLVGTTTDRGADIQAATSIRVGGAGYSMLEAGKLTVQSLGGNIRTTLEQDHNSFATLRAPHGLVAESEAAYVPLTVQAASGQTADVFRVEDSVGASLLAVDSVGRVGIGTDTPDAALAVHQSSADAIFRGYDNSGNLRYQFAQTGFNLGLGTDFRMYQNQVFGDLRFEIDSDGQVVEMYGERYGGTSSIFSLTWRNTDVTLYDAASIQSYNASGDHSGDLRFFTSDAAALAERLRIMHGGNVLIGTTTDTGERLQVAGGVKADGFTLSDGSPVVPLPQPLDVADSPTFADVSVDSIEVAEYVVGQGINSSGNIYLLSDGVTRIQANGSYKLLLDKSDGKVTYPFAFLNDTPSVTALRVQAAAGQTADVFRVEDSVGTPLVRVDAAGDLIGAGGSDGPALDFYNRRNNYIGQLYIGYAGDGNPRLTAPYGDAIQFTSDLEFQGNANIFSGPQSTGGLALGAQRVDTPVRFLTSPVTVGTYVEAARVTGQGNLLVGTTTDTGEKLQVAGDAIKLTNGYAYATITADSGTKISLRNSAFGKRLTMGLSGTTPYIDFETDNRGELRIGSHVTSFTSSGMFGVGTTDPTARLTVAAYAGQTADVLRVEDSVGAELMAMHADGVLTTGAFKVERTPGSGQHFAFTSDSNYNQIESEGVKPFVFRSSTTTHFYSEDYVRFNVGNEEVMRVTPSYNVLLGTDTDTGERLQVEGADNESVVYLKHSGVGFGSFIDFKASGGLTVAAINSSGLFRAPSGTVNGTAYSFLNDANTGFYNPASDNLAFVTGSVERLRLTDTGSTIVKAATGQTADVFRVEDSVGNGLMQVGANGNVGIGIDPSTHSQTRLSVKAEDPRVELVMGPSGSTAGSFRFVNNARDLIASIGYDSGALGGAFLRSEAGDISFVARDDGYAAIRSAAPKLIFDDSSSTATSEINFTNRSFLKYNSSSSGDKGLTISVDDYSAFAGSSGALRLVNASEDGEAGIEFHTANLERARVSAGGNLLVGTATDTGEKLQVAGGVGVYEAGVERVRITEAGAVHATELGVGSYDNGLDYKRWTFSHGGNSLNFTREGYDNGFGFSFEESSDRGVIEHSASGTSGVKLLIEQAQIGVNARYDNQGLFIWNRTLDEEMFKATANGRIALGKDANPEATLDVVSRADVPTIRAQAMAGQTADVFRVEDSVGASRLNVDSDGVVNAMRINSGGGSAAAPSITFGDDRSGIHTKNVYGFAFTVLGSEKLIVDANTVTFGTFNSGVGFVTNHGSVTQSTLGNDLQKPALTVANRAVDGYRGGLHLFTHGQDSGMFLTSRNASRGLISAGGAHVSGANTLRVLDPNPSAIFMDAGSIAFATDKGLTVGSDATLTERARISDEGLEVYNGQGVILASPDGTRYRTTISDAGTFAVTDIAATTTSVIEPLPQPLGTTDSPTFSGLNVESGITSGVGGKVAQLPQERTVAVRHSGSSYFAGEDLSTGVKFAMGTSNAGVGFAATLSDHNIEIRANNNVGIRVAPSGNVSIGVAGTPTNDTLYVLGSGRFERANGTPLTVRGLAGITADVFRVEDSVGDASFSVKADGTIPNGLRLKNPNDPDAITLRTDRSTTNPMIELYSDRETQPFIKGTYKFLAGTANAIEFWNKGNSTPELVFAVDGRYGTITTAGTLSLKSPASGVSGAPLRIGESVDESIWLSASSDDIYITYEDTDAVGTPAWAVGQKRYGDFFFTPARTIFGGIGPTIYLKRDGDMELTQPDKGVVLASPNGTRFRITVGDDGSLQTTAL